MTLTLYFSHCINIVSTVTTKTTTTTTTTTTTITTATTTTAHSLIYMMEPKVYIGLEVETISVLAWPTL